MASEKDLGVLFLLIAFLSYAANGIAGMDLGSLALGILGLIFLYSKK